MLVIDDNKTNLEVMGAILSSWNVKHSLANNGAQGIKMLEKAVETKHPFDIAVLDMQMPVMDGIEATEKIRDYKSGVVNHKVPIIAMTANAMKGDREKCLEAGMDDYIPKQIRMDTVVEVINKFIN